MSRKISLLMLALISFVPQFIFAQDDVAEKTSLMRSGNKIYVVLAVCLTILIGLILYLVRIDRSIKKIEDKN